MIRVNLIFFKLVDILAGEMGNISELLNKKDYRANHLDGRRKIRCNAFTGNEFITERI